MKIKAINLLLLLSNERIPCLYALLFNELLANKIIRK